MPMQITISAAVDEGFTLILLYIRSVSTQPNKRVLMCRKRKETCGFRSLMKTEMSHIDSGIHLPQWPHLARNQRHVNCAIWKLADDGGTQAKGGHGAHAIHL